MTIYVDDQLREATVRNGEHAVRGRCSRLMADDISELLAFGSRLGLRRAWLHRGDTSSERFDVTTDTRLLAIQLGAVQITSSEGDHLTRAKRAGVPFDLHQLRTDPHAFKAALTTPTVTGATGGPVRVRLSRAPGYRLPPDTVSVAAPSRWANPYRPATRTPTANQVAVEHFTAYLRRNPVLVEQAKAELRDRNLACWCPLSDGHGNPFPCHADVLLWFANESARKCCARPQFEARLMGRLTW